MLTTALAALLLFIPQSPEVGAKVYAAVADSVLLVIAQNDRGEEIATGSAFVIAGGRLLTNAHVVAKGRIFVRSGAFTVPCTVERTDNALDLAILNPAVPINAKPLVMAASLPPAGSTVFALGNPQGLERTISQGLFTGNRIIEDRQLLQVSAAISPGSSGGPVVTSRGEVVGVATSYLVDGQNLNFAVPMSVVRDFLSTTGASSQSPSTAATMAQRALESLEQTKLRYEKQKDGVWVVTFEGKNLNSIPVFVIASEDMLVVSTQLKTAAPLTAETLRALLLASYDANYSKVAMNKNGDVLALTELGPDFTTTAFRRAVDEVASLADAIGPLVVVSERPAVSSATEIRRPGTGATMSLLRGAFELVYDPAKWRENKTAEGVQLVHRSGDAFLAIIDERIEASLDGLRDVVMENAKKAAPDATLLGETSRQINGLAVRLIRYSGTVNGAKFTFLNQIYTGSAGSVQLAAFTGSNLVTEYESDFLEVFAGFRRVR